MSSNPNIQQDFGDINADNGSTVIAGPLQVILNVDGTILDQAPLAGVPTSALKTALHLATGADGWFRTPERTKTLVDALQIQGAELKTPSSFSFQKYRGFRESHDAMQGVFIAEGVASSITMPKVSTAVSGMPMSCLRAVTVCLVCLCSKNSTTSILQQLIPYGLLQYSTDDAKLDFEGPLLAGLNQWIDTVTLEEENNKFKDHLLGGVEISLAQLRQGPGLAEILMKGGDLASGEDTFILGVLKWAITPEHQRRSKQYPTRSLRAWMAASILSRLGFTIYASECLVTIQEEYDDMVNCEGWEACLVVSNNLNGVTDTLCEVVPSSDLDNMLPPRAMLLQDVPYFLFRHLKPADNATVQRAYQLAFEGAVKNFGDMKIELTIDLKIKLRVKHGTGAYSLLKHLGRSCKTSPLERYSFALEQLLEEWEGLAPDEWNFPPGAGTGLLWQYYGKEPKGAYFYIRVAMVLGAIYGICSCACRAQGTRLQGDFEICFSPENMRQGQYRVVPRWATGLMTAIFDGIPYDGWTSLLFEMFVGAPFPLDGPDWLTASGATFPSMRATPSRPEDEWIYGIQSHGFSAVSDLLVRVRMEPECLGIFHITRGQLLNLPYDSAGYLRGPSSSRHAEELQITRDFAKTIKPLNEITMYSEDDSRGSNPPSFKFDIEPFWEDEPRKIVLKVRDMGVPIASLYMTQIVHLMASHTVPCSCDAVNKRQVDIPICEKWFRIRVGDLSTYAISGVRPGKMANLRQGTTNYILDASESLEAFIYVLGIIDAARVRIARDCLPCAYSAEDRLKSGIWRKRASRVGTVIVIAPQNQNGSATDGEYYSSAEEEPQKGEDEEEEEEE